MIPHVLLMYHGGADPNGTHRAFVNGLAAGFLRRGHRPLFVDLASADGLSRLASEIQRPDVVLAYCEQGHGLGLTVDQDGSTVSLFDAVGKPVVSMMRDLPFYPWVIGNLRQDCAGARVYHVDEDSLIDLVPWLAPRPQNHSFHHSCYLDVEDAGQPDIPFGERPIELLYAGSWSDPESWRAAYREKYGDRARIYDDAVESCLYETGRPLWQKVASVCRQHGWRVDFQTDDAVDLFFHVNQFVRMRRRSDLFRRLAAHPMHLIWRGALPPGVELHPDTKVLGPQPLARTIALMKRSRRMVMALGANARALSERMLTAMYHGVAVVTTSNASIRELFTDRRQLVMIQPDAEDLDDALAAIEDETVAERVGSAGHEAVAGEFSCDRRVATYLRDLDLAPAAPTPRADEARSARVPEPTHATEVQADADSPRERVGIVELLYHAD
jgi:hypothetical protein